LDVTLHCPARSINLDFVEKLDPALERTDRRDEMPALVVHVLRRALPLFERREDNVTWADPVECLLDLHEAHLEPQALEFLRSFPATRGKI
jgi:hypothetical protein